MQDTASSTRAAQTVDATDWLKTVAIISTAVGHFGFSFIDQDYWYSVVGRLAAPILFFFLGYGQTRAVPLYLDLARRSLDIARELECRLELGGSEYPVELRVYPRRAPLRANPAATWRMGRRHPPCLRTYRGAATSGKDC
jgi:TraX protein